MLLSLNSPGLSDSDLAVAADLAENGSDVYAKDRKAKLARLHDDLSMGIIRDEGPGGEGIIYWPNQSVAAATR